MNDMNHEDREADEEIRRICREHIDASRERQLLPFWHCRFHQRGAQYLVDFLHRHPLAVNPVTFYSCTFEEDGTADVLEDGFTSLKATVSPSLEVKVCLWGSNNIRSLHWFPSLTAIATELYLYGCQLGDDGFGDVVDTILAGPAKTNLKELNAGYSGISPNDLSHATRLVQQSKLKALQLDGNPELFDDLAQSQSFFHVLKTSNTHLQRLYGDFPVSDTGTVTIDMLAADALTVNTSLTGVSFYNDSNVAEQQHFRRRVEPFLVRNRRRIPRQMAAVHELVRDDDNIINNNNNENPNADDNNSHDDDNRPAPPPRRIQGQVWRPMMSALIRDRNVSALFLLIQKATIAQEDGRGGAAVFPLCDEFEKKVKLEMEKKKNETSNNKKRARQGS